MAKVVLVTGANKGIGFEVSRALGKASFTVLLGARDAARGEEAAAKLRDEALDVRFGYADLEHAHETATALAEKISKEFGHLDVLVNNAGVADMTGADAPASTASITAPPPGTEKIAASAAFASATVAATVTPFPAASPSALTTIGAPVSAT